MVGTFVHLVRREGPAALWKGLAPSLVRALCYGPTQALNSRPLTLDPRPSTLDPKP